jgi:hypothetical protein
MGKQIYISEINAYLPDKLKHDLDICIDDVKFGEMDLVVVIDGKEGSGKSFDGRLVAKYCSFILGTTFSVDNIHFNTNDYVKFSESKPKFTVNVLDESREALNKKRGMSKSNVAFSNYLSENRDKQQVHIIILPAIHDLETYITFWRMKLLIHKLLGHTKDNNMMSGYKLVRGYFKVYENNKNLQQVLYNRAKFGYYTYPKDYKYMRKIKFKEIFSEEELKKYKDKKAKERRKKYDESVNKKQSGFELKYKKVIFDLSKKKKMTQEEIAQVTKISRTQIGNAIRDYRHYLDTSRDNPD